MNEYMEALNILKEKDAKEREQDLHMLVTMHKILLAMEKSINFRQEKERSQ